MDSTLKAERFVNSKILIEATKKKLSGDCLVNGYAFENNAVSSLVLINLLICRCFGSGKFSSYNFIFIVFY